MATSVIYNGVTYSVPSFGDVGYAQGPGNLSQYLVALATAVPAGVPFPNDISFTPPFGIVGVTTNSNAVAGNVGEYVQSVFGPVTFPATSVMGDATSIVLGAGDWDITFNFLFNASATVNTFNIGISTTPGNSFTGLVIGDNYAPSLTTFSAPDNQSADIVVWRGSFSAPTTVYAKFLASYGSTAPLAYGKLSARRMR